MKKTFRGKILTVLSGAVLAAVIFIGTPSASMAYTQATGIVSADAAKVRKEPSTSSDVVVGLLKGSTVTVMDEVTDSAGAVWYKVSVENNSGYIRSDLMLKAAAPATGTPAANSSTQTTPSTSETASKPAAATTATPIAETKAYVNFDSARVREGASTNHEIVGSVVKNTSVTITGEAKASDGKKWYQIKYPNAAGNEMTGFVRSDLLTVGDPPAEEKPAEEKPADSQTENEEAGESAEENTEGTEAGEEGTEMEVPEEEVPAPVPEETEKPDYEMVYTQNNEGVEEWYLYDNINGTRQTLAGLLAAAEAGTKQSEGNAEQLSTQKIIIIVLAVVIAILVIAVTLLLFKIKDIYDEDYDDDEEDDEDEEDEDDEDDEDDEEEEIRVVRRKHTNEGVKNIRTAGTGKASQVKSSKVDSSQVKPRTVPVKRVEYDPEEEAFEAGKAVVEKTQPKRKAKNFLVDDEFEFEFLNMDDKN